MNHLIASTRKATAINSAMRTYKLDCDEVVALMNEYPDINWNN